MLAAVAAHGKTNGLAGRKLSRFAAWWAFEFTDTGNGFESGYKTWTRAADATSHLFFAYLRSLSPESAQGKGSILKLPLSLQQLLESTEYPPVRQESLYSRTQKVVMIVETVSPTPFALLRRAKNFHYREEDQLLRQFSDKDDPIAALTDECRRVLKSIASANESTSSKTSTSLLDPSWSRFEDIGFGGFSDEFGHADEPENSVLGRRPQQPKVQGLRTTPASKTVDLGRPTTPSWADFLSSGFQTEQSGRGPTLLPPDKQLPPISINSRSGTSQSHRRNDDVDSTLEPAELASITAFLFDDTFWWVWMTSLAGEEPLGRKAAFGRCALVETNFSGQWLVMEEIIKGAAPEPEAGAYIAEKKSRFGFSRKSRITRTKSSGKGALIKAKANAADRNKIDSPASKTSIAPDQQARIQAAAAALQQKNRTQQQEDLSTSPRRARYNDDMSIKTNSVLTLQPMIMNEAAPAMKWANTYDKNEIRARYLGDNFAGRGSNISLLNGGIASSNDPTQKEPSSTAPKDSKTPADDLANKENIVPPRRKAASSSPRDETKTYSRGDPTLVDVINRGPPDTQGVQRKQQNQPPQPPAKDSVERKPAPAPTGAPPPVPTQDKARTAPAEVPPTAIPLPGETPLPATPNREVSAPTPAKEWPRPMERLPVAAQTLVQPTQNEKKADKPEANGNATPKTSTPESPKQNKLKKKSGPGGFKGIFGRKKDQPASFKPPPRSSSNTSSAVAAARAAYEAKSAQNQKTPEKPTPKVTSKRFSTLGRKKETEAPLDVAKEIAPTPEEKLGEHPALATSAEPQAQYAETDRSYSVAETNEEQRAEREFKTFDQGPLEDVPAFVPEDSPPEEPISHASEEQTDHYSEGETQTEDVSQLGDEEENDLTKTVSPNDRWAQIRKNAAERAATRQSEEHSRRTDRTDDDGDTSGEESKFL